MLLTSFGKKQYMNLGSEQNLSATTFKYKKSKVTFQLLKKLAWNRYGIITLPIDIRSSGS